MLRLIMREMVPRLSLYFVHKVITINISSGIDEGNRVRSLTIINMSVTFDEDVQKDSVTIVFTRLHPYMY